MVQIALIDLAVDLRDKESVHTLEQFTDQTSGRTRTRAEGPHRIGVGE